MTFNEQSSTNTAPEKTTTQMGNVDKVANTSTKAKRVPSVDPSINLSARRAVGQSVGQTVGQTLVLSEVAALKPGIYHFSDVANIDDLIEQNYRDVDTDGKDFIKLRDSILLAGVKEPIQIFLSQKENGDPHIRIVAGHHRTRVVKTLRAVGNHTALPAILEVATENEDQAAAIGRCVTSAVTNTLRKKLRGIERAWIIQELLASGMRQNQVTLAMGVTKKVVERANNLNSLPPDAQAYIKSHQSQMRENRLFEIAQEYKRQISDIGGKGRPEEASVNQKVMDALEAEVRGEGPAAKSSGAGRKTTTMEIPEGYLLINVEKFKAHLTLIDRLPKGVGEKIIESLVGSQFVV